MCCEIYLLVSGLADDHAAAREALLAALRNETPAGMVVDVVEPPEIGFKFLVELVATTEGALKLCHRIRRALVRELDEREVMFAGLSIALPGTYSCPHCPTST